MRSLVVIYRLIFALSTSEAHRFLLSVQNLVLPRKPVHRVKPAARAYRACLLAMVFFLHGIFQGGGEVASLIGCCTRQASKKILSLRSLRFFVETGPTQAVGLDLGLEDFLTPSEGLKVGAYEFYRDLEPALASAQRAYKKQRTRAIHAKVANRRKDMLHRLSTALVKEHCACLRWQREGCWLGEDKEG